MLNQLQLIFIFFFSASLIIANAKASEIECVAKVNFDQLTDSRVQTELNEKLKVLEADTFRVFVTQLPDDEFEMELFVSDIPMRIYSKSRLRTAIDKLYIGTWTREAIYDINCKLSEKQ